MEKFAPHEEIPAFALDSLSMTREYSETFFSLPYAKVSNR